MEEPLTDAERAEVLGKTVQYGEYAYVDPDCMVAVIVLANNCESHCPDKQFQVDKRVYNTNCGQRFLWPTRVIQQVCEEGGREMLRLQRSLVANQTEEEALSSRRRYVNLVCELPPSPVEHETEPVDPLQEVSDALTQIHLTPEKEAEVKEEVKDTPLPATMEQSDSILCIVCFERERSHLFLPCRHLVCCETCAVQVACCVSCREPITSRERVYT